MTACLLDSHAMLWAERGDLMLASAIVAIEEAQVGRSLFISPISAWEIGVASQKKNSASRPHLVGVRPEIWFQQATSKLRGIVQPITEDIAIEASRIPALYGSGDLGTAFSSRPRISVTSH